MFVARGTLRSPSGGNVERLSGASITANSLPRESGRLEKLFVNYDGEYMAF